MTQYGLRKTVYELPASSASMLLTESFGGYAADIQLGVYAADVQPRRLNAS